MSYPEEIPIGIIIEPVMHHNVPGAVVVSKGGGVPPVLITEKERDIGIVLLECTQSDFLYISGDLGKKNFTW